MTDTISLVGVIATPPKSMQTSSGLSIVSFRLASSQRRYDRARNTWVDADTNWYTVTAFRQLADNAFSSLAKGDRVFVSGRLRVRSWENGERSGTVVEIDADSLGPDLLFGTSTFTKVSSRTAETGQQDPGVLAAPESPGPVPVDPAAASASSSLAPASEPSLASSDGDAVADPELVGVSAASAPGWHVATDEAPF